MTSMPPGSAHDGVNPGAGQPGGRADVVGWAAVVAFALVGVFGYLMRAVDWFRSVPGDLGDARFNSVILEHMRLWVTGRAESLWSPGYFFPHPDVLGFGDNHFGSFWTYAVARALGASRESAFDVWFVVGFLATYAACVYALRKLGFSWLAVAAGAFVFTFALPVLAKDGHAQLLYRFAIPLAALEWLRFLASRKAVRIATTGCWLAVQFFCSIYLGVFLSMLLAAITVAAIVVRPDWARLVVPAISRRAGVAIFATWVALSAALAAVLAKYQSVAHEYGFRRQHVEIVDLMPRPTSYLVADRSPLSSWAGRWADVAARQEQQMFIGIGVSVLVVAGVWMSLKAGRHRRFVLVAMLTWLALVVLTLRVGDHSLYDLLWGLPGLNSVRAVSRIVLVMLVPVAVLVAFGVERLRRVLPAPLVALLAVALLAPETVTYAVNRTPAAAWQAREYVVRAAWESQPHRRDDVLLNLNRARENFWLPEVDAMIVAQDERIPTVNGYSGNIPLGYVTATSCAEAAQAMVPQYLASDRWPEFRRVLSRIRGIPADGCAAELAAVAAIKPFRGALPDGAFDGVTVAVSDVRLADADTIQFRVTITNAGDHYVPSRTVDGKPVGIVWRFVRPGQEHDVFAGHVPVQRQGLLLDVGVGKTTSETVRVPIRRKQGPYRVVVKLVQDGVAPSGSPLAPGAAEAASDAIVVVP